MSIVGQSKKDGRKNIQDTPTIQRTDLQGPAELMVHSLSEQSGPDQLGEWVRYKTHLQAI